MINRRYAELAQTILKRQGADIAIDGFFGTESDGAADRMNGIDLPAPRQIALTVQRQWNRLPSTPDNLRIKEDAWWGPVTEDIADRLLGETWARPDAAIPDAGIPDAAIPDGASADPPPKIGCWSPTDNQMSAHYGLPGTNQTTVALPYPMRLDWDLSTVVTKTTCHRKVARSFTAALEQTLHHYGRKRIEELGLNRYGGCLNVRRKRGGSTWSAHAWGSAVDFWPSANSLRENSKTARFARPEYRPFFDIWATNGWMSLGRCYDFDWMHLQRNPTPEAP